VPERAEEVIFLGAMDYRPNVDAVCWFADQVWPQVLQARPQAHFLVVGSNPTAPVQALQHMAGVTVTGTVPEVAPYLDRARMMVAPLRMARGIQNKVLEGMAAGLPVVTTPEGADGLDVVDGQQLMIRRDPQEMAAAVINLLENPQAAAEYGAKARHLTETRYSWDGQLAPLLARLSPSGDAESVSPCQVAL
jgi:glycosyltransferase involved in cell wall biosynthesis